MGNLFSYFSTQTYVVGSQKNLLNERVLLSTQNICQKLLVRKYLQFYAENFCLSKHVYLTGCLVQSVTCLTVDTRLSADPGVASLTPSQYYTLVEIFHEIISKAILLPSADSRRVVVSHKRKLGQIKKYLCLG